AAGAGSRARQVRNIAVGTPAVVLGDLSRKITVGVRGENPRARGRSEHDGGPAQLVRVGGGPRGAGVGTAGRLGGQADVEGVAGTWTGRTHSVPFMASKLGSQERNRVPGAPAP